MTVTPTNASAAAAAAAAAAANSGTGLAQNFQSFLQLLTTQLRHQNPLEPLDTNQFTQQLVQFAQVEQQINMNSSLSSLIWLQEANQIAAAMGFVGATVRFEGDTAKLADGEAKWTFSSDKAATATINIHNANGELVYSETRTASVGSQNFVWNGRNSDGLLQPDGDYKISITAKDASGQNVAISTEVEGVVDGVDMSGDVLRLRVGDTYYTLKQVKEARRSN